VHQPGEGGPRIDPAKRTIRTIKALTGTDFPEQLLTFSQDGSFAQAIEMASVELPEEPFPGGIRWDGDGQWVPDELDMIWTHFLGETIPSARREDHHWNRVERTTRPLLVKQGKDTFLIQGFNHHLKKLNAATGELIRQYSPEDDSSGQAGLREIQAASGFLEKEIPVGLYDLHDTCQLAGFTGKDGILHVVRYTLAGDGPDNLEVTPGRIAAIPGSFSDTSDSVIEDKAAGSGTFEAIPGDSGKISGEVFSWKVGSSVSFPLFTEERLVVCSENGIYLFGYDRNMNFRLLDRLPVPVEATPVLYGGRLFVASLNGYLYCLGEKD